MAFIHGLLFRHAKFTRKNEKGDSGRIVVIHIKRAFSYLEVRVDAISCTDSSARACNFFFTTLE